MINKPLGSLKEIPEDFDFTSYAKKEIVDWLEHEILESTDSAQMALEQLEKDKNKKNKKLYLFHSNSHNARVEQLKLLLECYQ